MQQVTHGGAREGAGRKPGTNPRVKTLAVSLTQLSADTIDWYCDKHQCSKSEFINRLIEKFSKQKGGQ